MSETRKQRSMWNPAHFESINRDWRVFLKSEESKQYIHIFEKDQAFRRIYNISTSEYVEATIGYAK